MRIELTESQREWLGRALDGYPESTEVPDSLYASNLADVVRGHPQYTEELKDAWAKYNCLVWAQKLNIPTVPIPQEVPVSEEQIPYFSMISSEQRHGFNVLREKMNREVEAVKEGSALIAATIVSQIETMGGGIETRSKLDREERLSRAALERKERSEERDAAARERLDREARAATASLAAFTGMATALSEIVPAMKECRNTLSSQMLGLQEEFTKRGDEDRSERIAAAKAELESRLMLDNELKSRALASEASAAETHRREQLWLWAWRLAFTALAVSVVWGM